MSHRPRNDVESGSRPPAILPGAGAQVRQGGSNPGPPLSALVAGLERRAAEAEQMQATAPVATVLRTIVGELRALGDGADGDLVARPVAPAVDRLLTIREAARLLRCSPKWLYRNPRLPFLRRLSGRVLRVDAAALARWVARRA